MKTSYKYDEIMAEPSFATRLRRGHRTFHGGLDAAGSYLPPRSRHRCHAIAAWTQRLAAAGQPTEVIRLADVDREFFPNVVQAKLLLRAGARGAMTRILTLIGITEGFGNDGIRSLPELDLAPLFREPLDGTCLDHLYRGLLEAHGNDEAGRGQECGHDEMWYAIRDAALEDPTITPDMYENLPISPPPGYAGPAKPAPEAISVTSLAVQTFPNLDPMLELLLKAFAQILVIELMAYSTFAWAREVLADREVCADPAFAAPMVDYIQADENIHVGYLQCALAETRCRTLVDATGQSLPGDEVVDRICRTIVEQNTGGRWERMNLYRMRQIRTELAGMRGGDQLLRELSALGPVPEEPAEVRQL